MALLVSFLIDPSSRSVLAIVLSFTAQNAKKQATVIEQFVVPGSHVGGPGSGSGSGSGSRHGEGRDRAHLMSRKQSIARIRALCWLDGRLSVSVGSWWGPGVARSWLFSRFALSACGRQALVCMATRIRCRNSIALRRKRVFSFVTPDQIRSDQILYN